MKYLQNKFFYVLKFHDNVYKLQFCKLYMSTVKYSKKVFILILMTILLTTCITSNVTAQSSNQDKEFVTNNGQVLNYSKSVENDLTGSTKAAILPGTTNSSQLAEDTPFSPFQKSFIQNYTERT